MTTATLEKEVKNIKFDKEKFVKEMFLTDEQIKSRLDELDEYYKTHKFVGTDLKTAYINGLKRIKQKYGI